MDEIEIYRCIAVLEIALKTYSIVLSLIAFLGLVFVYNYKLVDLVEQVSFGWASFDLVEQVPFRKA